MNKSKSTNSIKALGKRKFIIFNTIDKSELTKAIYLVKYEEIQYIPTSSRKCIKNTYNLLTFENLNGAKEYLESVCNFTVIPLIESDEFKILLDPITESQLNKNSEDNIVYQKSIKIIGNNEYNNDQTKLFTFSIEELNLKSL